MIPFIDDNTLAVQDVAALGSDDPGRSDFQTLSAPENPWLNALHYGGFSWADAGWEDVGIEPPSDGFGWMDDGTLRVKEEGGCGCGGGGSCNGNCGGGEACCGSCASGGECEGDEGKYDGVNRAMRIENWLHLIAWPHEVEVDLNDMFTWVHGVQSKVPILCTVPCHKNCKALCDILKDIDDGKYPDMTPGGRAAIQEQYELCCLKEKDIFEWAAAMCSKYRMSACPNKNCRPYCVMMMIEYGKGNIAAARDYEKTFDACCARPPISVSCFGPGCTEASCQACCTDILAVETLVLTAACAAGCVLSTVAYPACFGSCMTYGAAAVAASWAACHLGCKACV